jgi:hypothetical protein
MYTQLQPPFELYMVSEQDMFTLQIYHPGRPCHVAGREAALETILLRGNKFAQTIKHETFVSVERLVGVQQMDEWFPVLLHGNGILGVGDSHFFSPDSWSPPPVLQRKKVTVPDFALFAVASRENIIRAWKR